MSLTKTIKKVKAEIEKEVQPLWTGPSGEGANGGVTQGLLGRFLGCRERFRVWAIEGLRPRERFNPYLEFGNLWHAAEEAHAASRDIQAAVSAYTETLMRRYPLDRESIVHWSIVTYELFPRYVEHWQAHPDMQSRKPMFQEQPFDVPYTLPDGRTVRIRGKWDSVDVVTKGKQSEIWLQENKTKSSIVAEKIERQLRNDLQTMLYLIALTTDKRSAPVVGVRYNVIRRGAHKTPESMMKKFEEDKRNGRIGEWFGRWNVGVSAADLDRFRKSTLDPLLEHLCIWWDAQLGQWPKKDKVSWEQLIAGCINYRMPYGTYNPVAEGGYGDLDDYLDTGSKVGLHRAAVMFPELEKEDGNA